MSIKDKDTSLQIQAILDKNIIGDLNRFIEKRQCLNRVNFYFIYLFHFIQSAGILTTAIAAGTHDTELIWIGVGLNIFATLIHVYEKTNNGMLHKLLNDITKIKEGNYIDEGEIIDTDSQKHTLLEKDTFWEKV